MSYLIYINGQLINEKGGISFAQTKQVNDISNLVNRNTNYTQNIKIPRTANNKKIFENAFNVGVNSTLPYQKATCDVIDIDTGQHIIYGGWAVLLESTATDYNITIYDGSIDFFRAIENITISEAGVSDLNHVKDLSTVVETWTDTDLPYRYILADYNGNNDAGGNVNIDFQVPCASVPYLWDRVFSFIGFDYEGSIFSHEKFTNLWLSYPKPVSLEEPVVIPVTEQDSEILTEIVEYPSGGGTFYGSVSNVALFPDNDGFDTDYYTFADGCQSAGTYRLSFLSAVFTRDNPTDSTSRIRILIFDNLNQIVSENFIDISSDNYIDLYLLVGYRVILEVVDSNGISFNGGSNPFAPSRLLSGATTTTMVKIEGYSLGFDEAFIDFKVSDFIREILVRFGLTPFKDKYSNTVKFLTLTEYLQNQSINNLSDKFNGKISEKYVFGSYAKSNNFKYKYNDDEQSHNDGSFNISNENLAESVTILNSLIYAPERLTSEFLTQSNVYPIWQKQIKDDATVEYKDLDGRFYFLRADRVDQSITIGSNLLGGTLTADYYYRESYYRLPFNQILFDWYRPMKAIFDKAKFLNVEFNFRAVDVFNFDFSRLIYIEQLGSYYLMNKINNFVKGKPTKCELIEVDYFTETDDTTPIPIDYTVLISNPSIIDCEITFDVATNYEQPVDAQLIVYAGELLGNFTQFIYTPIEVATVTADSVTFPITMLPANAFGYKFEIKLITGNIFDNIVSNLSEIVAIDGSCYVEPDYPDTLTITNVINLGLDSGAILPNVYRYNIIYAHTGVPTNQSYVLKIEAFGGFSGGWFLVGEYQKFADTPTDLSQVVTAYNATKLRISINGVISNEYNV